MGGPDRRGSAPARWALAAVWLGLLAGRAHGFVPAGTIAGKVVVLQAPGGGCLTRCPVGAPPRACSIPIRSAQPARAQRANT